MQVHPVECINGDRFLIVHPYEVMGIYDGVIIFHFRMATAGFKRNARQAGNNDDKTAVSITRIMMMRNWRKFSSGKMTSL